MPLKAYLPKSLFGRALLIIMLPIAIMQIAVAYFFFNAHWDQVTDRFRLHFLAYHRDSIALACVYSLYSKPS